MIEIATSILNINNEDSLKTFYNLEAAKTDYFHIDVMDGIFVNDNTTMKMLEYSENLSNIINTPLDIHLMVKDTKKYIDEYLSVNPCFITIHYEAFEDVNHLKEILSYIKSNGIKVGIAIKPETDIEKIYSLLDYIHLVLVMTVEPGKGGQSLIPATIEKIHKLSKYRNENNLDFYIEADGGIKLDNIGLLKNAGIDIAVCGTAIINSDDYKQIISKLKE